MNSSLPKCQALDVGALAFFFSKIPLGNVNLFLIRDVCVHIKLSNSPTLSPELDTFGSLREEWHLKLEDYPRKAYFKSQV